MKKFLNILLVDDDQLWQLSFSQILKNYGVVTVCSNEQEALDQLKAQQFDIAFIDLDLSGPLRGLELVFKAKTLGLYSVIVSARDEEETIIEGYNRGAMDYLAKPVSQSAIDLVFNRHYCVKNFDLAEKQLAKRFITKDQVTLDRLEIIKKINLSNKSILLSGESGTGKSCLAKIIHDVSNVKGGDFIALNCSQFNESTIESELFGHVKGSYTGASKDKTGLIQMANKGTLFLDEIHSLSPRAQQKLLTALESGEIYPLGSEKPVKVEFRVICATCEEIEELVASKIFRKDLYFRIKTFVLHIPSLKERRCDILPLFQYFLDKKERKTVITESAKDFLKNYSWPGNAREIEDQVENWHVQGLGVIRPNDLPTYITINNQDSEATNLLTDELISLAKIKGLKEVIEIIKHDLFGHFMKKHYGKQIEVAKDLKISKSMVSKLAYKREQEVLNDEQLRLH